jgi:3-methyladenine DNA glycosylase/8-oxoguanine DNA glycosylase
MTDKKKEDSPEALKSLANKYEDILEAQIRVLYMRLVNFIAASQLPLVHINTVLDLLKRDIVEQLKDGYFPTEKK